MPLTDPQKKKITDNFLTTPCIRCSDPSHSCLDCTVLHSPAVNTGPYGVLSKARKSWANEWIEQLKEKFQVDKSQKLFDKARENKEAQDRRQGSTATPATVASALPTVKTSALTHTSTPTQSTLPVETLDPFKTPVPSEAPVSAQASRSGWSSVAASGHNRLGANNQDTSQPIASRGSALSTRGGVQASGIISVGPDQVTDGMKKLDVGPASPNKAGDGSDSVAEYEYEYHFQEEQIQHAPTAAEALKRAPAFPTRNKTDMDPAKLSSLTLNYPARAGFATYQNPVRLLTNHFQLSCSDNKTPTLYEFKIPQLEGKGKRKARAAVKGIITKCHVLRTHQDHFATDYFTTIVSWIDLRPLMRNGGHTLLSTAGEKEEYNLQELQDGQTTLLFEREVDMRELFDSTKLSQEGPSAEIKPMIDLFNVIISKCVEGSAVQTIPGGANKFYRKDAIVGLGRSLCTLRGYSYTVKAGVAAVLLNLNSITSAFWRPIMLHEVFDDEDSFGEVPWGEFDGIVRGLRVYITYERGDKKKDLEAYKRLNTTEARIKSIEEIGEPADSQRFPAEDGSEPTVAEHYENTYGVPLKRSDLNVVNLGTKNEPRWYPPEKLRILAYQKYKGLVPTILSGDMLRTACQRPPEAKALVAVEGLETLGVPRANGNNMIPLPRCPLFTLRPTLLQVDGGRLIVPTIQYGNKKTANPNNGRWMFANRELFKHSMTNAFKCILMADSRLHKRAPEILQKLKEYAGDPSSTGQNYRVASLENAGKEAESLPNLQYSTLDGTLRGRSVQTNMALLVLNKKNIQAYSAFKDLCDRKYGLHALCITGGILKGQNNGDKYSNLMLKLNLKAAGINHTISGGILSEGLMRDTLVLGADVTHPGPGSIPGCPSIAAIVGSVDAHAGRFLGSMRLQSESKKEIIDEIIPMVCERIKDWVIEMNPKGPKVLPQTILYYRDGVSESQYGEVNHHELSKFHTAFVKAVKELKQEKVIGVNAAPTMPKIIAIVCGKRHHVRFYPNDARSADKFSNCHPGTTVDDVVTSPHYQDFYLQSHAAIKGTARPAHYFIVKNETKRTVDYLRRFTHELCYTYVRAPVGVSYASPAYYADRLCERGRCYLRSLFVAPKGTPLRKEFNEFKDELEAKKKKKRDSAHPPPSRQQNRSAPRPQKPSTLVDWENKDKVAVQEVCDGWAMEKARDEFERYHKGGNPWHPSLSKTMFWM